MARSREFPFRRPVEIVMLWALVLMSGIALILSGRSAIAEFRGATVDAEVVGITTNAPGRLTALVLAGGLVGLRHLHRNR